MFETVKNNEEVDLLESRGTRMYDFDIYTSDAIVAFDGSRWLIEKPDLNPGQYIPKE